MPKKLEERPATSLVTARPPIRKSSAVISVVRSQNGPKPHHHHHHHHHHHRSVSGGERCAPECGPPETSASSASRVVLNQPSALHATSKEDTSTLTVDSEIVCKAGQTSYKMKTRGRRKTESTDAHKIRKGQTEPQNDETANDTEENMEIPRAVPEVPSSSYRGKGEEKDQKGRKTKPKVSQTEDERPGDAHNGSQDMEPAGENKRLLGRGRPATDGITLRSTALGGTSHKRKRQKDDKADEDYAYPQKLRRGQNQPENEESNFDSEEDMEVLDEDEHEEEESVPVVYVSPYRGVSTGYSTNLLENKLEGQQMNHVMTRQTVKDLPQKAQIQSRVRSRDIEFDTLAPRESISRHRSMAAGERENHLYWNSFSDVPYDKRTTKPAVLPQTFEVRRVKEKIGGPTARKSSASPYARKGWLCTSFLIFVVLLLLAVLVAFLMLQRREKVFKDEKLIGEEFDAQFMKLESSFPGQRKEVWRRSKILLEKHLQSAQPTEPVSMILTAGRGAERTLHCLANRLATAYSSALNSSVLHIDGLSKTSQDSDQVKLDIDEDLKGAFEGDKRAAVIHRFEELPPASTLIFYKYCDHENAAYKEVSLIFTVLLQEDELSSALGLGEVEEKVRDHIEDKFLKSREPASFKDMDRDKLGGLWSRISHLILPVNTEGSIEQQGCDF
ncbi:torsin-1A-interacting protein 1 [Amia ocellicauda]|uniref:torsin-1A-interacting protein 1 n=1 Tax=Amia ocellicauda TaxID=2972642 RepID=UPI003463985B